MRTFIFHDCIWSWWVCVPEPEGSVSAAATQKLFILCGVGLQELWGLRLTQDGQFCQRRDVLVLVGGGAAVGAGVVVGDGPDEKVAAGQQRILLVPAEEAQIWTTGTGLLRPGSRQRVLMEDSPGLEDFLSSPPLDARGRISWGGTFQHGVGPQQGCHSGGTLEELEGPGHAGFWKRAEKPCEDHPQLLPPHMSAALLRLVIIVYISRSSWLGYQDHWGPSLHRHPEVNIRAAARPLLTGNSSQKRPSWIFVPSVCSVGRCGFKLRPLPPPPVPTHNHDFNHKIT